MTTIFMINMAKLKDKIVLIQLLFEKIERNCSDEVTDYDFVIKIRQIKMVNLIYSITQIKMLIFLIILDIII